MPLTPIRTCGGYGKPPPACGGPDSAHFGAKADMQKIEGPENGRKINARRFRDHFWAAFFSEIPFFILSRPGSSNFGPKIGKPISK